MTYYKINKEYTLNNYDLNCQKRFATNRLLLFLQDIAQYQSEQFGINEKTLIDYNCAWILVKYDIDIIKRPKYREKIRIETYPVGNKFMFWFREFNIYGESNDLIAKAKSCWILFDINTRKPMNMPEKMYKAYGYDKIENKVLPFKNITKLKDVTCQKTFEVCYTDIDVNHHVNNCVYLRWAQNTIPVEILNNYQMNKIEIIYKKEGHLENTITSNVEVIRDDDNYICIHEILNEDGEILCQLRTSWR